jgi:hypothetical protein
MPCELCRYLCPQGGGTCVDTYASQGGNAVELSHSQTVPRAKSRGEVEANKLASTPLSQRNGLNSSVNPTQH